MTTTNMFLNFGGTWDSPTYYALNYAGIIHQCLILAIE